MNVTISRLAPAPAPGILLSTGEPPGTLKKSVHVNVSPVELVDNSVSDVLG
jgi:hypothetical protein